MDLAYFVSIFPSGLPKSKKILNSKKEAAEFISEYLQKYGKHLCLDDFDYWHNVLEIEVEECPRYKEMFYEGKKGVVNPKRRRPIEVLF